MEQQEQLSEHEEFEESSISDEDVSDSSLSEAENDIPIPQQPKQEMNYDEIMKLADDIMINGRMVMREHAITKSMKQKGTKVKPEPKPKAEPKAKVEPKPKAQPETNPEEFAEFLLDKVDECSELFEAGDKKQAETVIDYLDKLIEIKKLTVKQKKEMLKQFK